jgi:2,3-bisphosphoglycerate-dependent phosphoglycerate mutase
VEVVFIRHGLPERVDVSQGRADPGLSPVGQLQAERVARSLESERLDAIYSSPMLRALQTAAPLAAAHQRQVQVEEDLTEFDQNATFYIPYEELRRSGDPRWEAMLRGEFSGTNGGLREFQSRIVATVEGLIGAHRGHRIAVVCHAGVLLAYLSHILGTDEMLFFQPVYTSIHRVLAASNGRREITALNEACHLANTRVPSDSRTP